MEEGSSLKAHIEKCFDAPRVAYDNITNTIFLTYCPSAEYSIASGYCSKNGRMIVLGLDCISARTAEEEYAAVRRHILELIRLFPDTMIAVIPENNLGMEADSIINFISDIPQVYPYIDGASGRYGITRTRQLTLDYMFITNSAFVGDGVGFGEVLLTTTPDMLLVMKNSMMEMSLGSLTPIQETLYIIQMLIYWIRQITCGGMKIIK